MKIAGIREVRERAAAYLGGDEPVLVTRHGKISGLFLPLEDPTRLPEDLRRELAGPCRVAWRDGVRSSLEQRHPGALDQGASS